MLFFVLNLVVRRLTRLVVGRSAVAALEVENAVLRHQLRVVRRSVKRPLLSRSDRVLLELFGGALQAALRLTQRGQLGLEDASAAAASVFLDGARAR